VTGRRRRALALGGLALVMGAMAASDVGRREAAVARQLSPQVEVVVARRDLPAGRRIGDGDVTVRRIPRRFAAVGAAAVAPEVLGQRLAVPAPRGAPIGLAHLEVAPAGLAVRRGERAAEVVAVAPPGAIVPGARVDVVVTRDREAGTGGAELALQNAEVLGARPVAETGEAHGQGLPRVAATLRVTVRQAVFLAAAQAFAREIRLLPRAPGDQLRQRAVAVDEALR
jgi:pilus assembly protein CpaB